jgi:phosphopantothenoylcysteine decarboxylase
MNTFMWQHPATALHLRQLRQWYPKLRVIAPVAKRLACGDVGVGAMASIEEMCQVIKSLSITQGG